MSIFITWLKWKCCSLCQLRLEELEQICNRVLALRKEDVLVNLKALTLSNPASYRCVIRIAKKCMIHNLFINIVGIKNKGSVN